jgi:hypothetical protein
MACRDKVRGEAAVSELEESTGKKAILLQLNLANLRSVKAAAEEFLRYACITLAEQHSRH